MKADPGSLRAGPSGTVLAENLRSLFKTASICADQSYPETMNTSLLSLLRALCWTSVAIFLSVMPVGAEQFGLFTYRVVGATIEITNYPQSAVGKVEIPAQIDGKPVTSIGYQAFNNCKGMNGISIPTTVTHIGEEAFLACGLTSVTISEGVANIGRSGGRLV